MTFPELHSYLSGDVSFRTGADQYYHNSKDSPFMQVPDFNIVSGFVIDYMQTVCLVAMKRMLKNIWNRNSSNSFT